MKAAAIFEKIQERLDKIDDSTPRTVVGIFQWNITGDSSVESFVLDLKALKVSKGTVAAPDVTFAVSDDDFVALNTKTLAFADALSSGRLSFTGDKALADALAAKIGGS